MRSVLRRQGLPLLGLALALATALVGEQAVATQPRRDARRHTRIGGFEAAEGEVIVKYRAGRGPAAHGRVVVAADVDDQETLSPRGVLRLHSRRHGTAALLRQLAADPDVEFAEPNYVRYVTTLPNDPAMPNLWGLFNTGSNPTGGGGVAGADIDADAAWNTTTGSRAHVVGIIDTGVDYNHPDLAANMWTAPRAFQVTVGGQVVTCQAGTHGFNAITRSCNPMDDHRHGTHVAGTIGGVGNNGVGVAGVNWVASMMALKFQGPGGTGYTSDAVLAIEFAIQTKAQFAASNAANVRVLSNSWGGGGHSTALVNAIAAANASDMLFVAAAGNNGANNDASPVYPASYTVANMLTVASSTSSDVRSSFSNYGATSVHLAAPGSAILSTTPNNGYMTLQGTSMATPHVSGAAMLALSMCSLTTAQLKSLILTSVDPVPALSGLTITGGRLNAARALAGCTQPTVTAIELTSDLAAPQPPNTTITWTAAASGGEPPYQYQWVVFDGAAWTTMTGWSTNDTFAWTPTAANPAHQVSARARSAWNTGARELSAARPFAVMPRVTALTLAPHVAAPQAAGTPITWTAAASGGQAPYQYQWAAFDGTAWTTLTGWQSSPTFVWTPTTAHAATQVAVRARGSWNSGAREMATTASYAILPKVTSVSLTPDLAAPRAPNTTVTWTAVAGGGQAPYQYQWALFNGSAWVNLTDWGASSTFAWTPTAASAAYQVAVRVRGSWNSGPREMAAAQGYVVMPLVSALTLTPTLAAPQGVGTPLTFAAAASGGQPPYLYQWAVFDGAAWTTLTGWQSSTSFTWTPLTASTATQVAVRAKGSWNIGARELATTVAYAVPPRVTTLTVTSDLSSPRAAGATITFTATAGGGQAPYEYQWATFDGATWTTVTGWQSSPTFAWTPTQANANYQIAARARGTWNSAGAREMATVRPFVIQ